MSLPELLHHQHRFIGCLGIRRIPRLRLGQALGMSGQRASAVDLEAQERIALACLHQLRRGSNLPTGSATPPEDILLATHAYDEPGLHHCPALGPDGRCSLHGDRKPLQCHTVPLDALLPDRLQWLVLSQRHAETRGRSSPCIVPGSTGDAASGHCAAASSLDNAPLLVKGEHVVDEHYSEALRLRRAELSNDKRLWGHAVFRSLEPELFARVERNPRVPTDGMLVMSIAPVLMVALATSERCRARIREYLDAQIALGERTLQQCQLGSTTTAHGQRELQAFTQTNRRLRAALAQPSAAGVSGIRATTEQLEIEQWLGLAEA